MHTNVRLTRSRAKPDVILELLYRYLMASRNGAIRSPLSTGLRACIGLRTELVFENGFRITLRAHQRPLFRGLISLTYPYGVTFAQDEGKATGSNWRINLETGVLVLPNGIRMTLDSIYEPGILAETFLNDVHFRGADFSGLSVIDVGASIGDTALYFASLGAIVYAYEPDPLNFESLLRNVSLNPQLQRKIVPVNAAVGIDGQVTLHAGLGSSSGLYGKGGNELTVPSLSLRSILERNHLAEAYLLKVDAKGAEFEILSQPEIAHFHLISLEYSPYLRPGHTVAELLAVLTAQGFVVKRKFRHNDSFFRLEEHGMIHAERA